MMQSRAGHADVGLLNNRLVDEDGFGKKARHLNPGFATNRKRQRFVSDQDYISDRWTEAQNRFFEERGLDLRVDPKRAVQTVHHGPSWHAPGILHWRQISGDLIWSKAWPGRWHQSSRERQRGESRCTSTF